MESSDRRSRVAALRPLIVARVPRRRSRLMAAVFAVALTWALVGGAQAWAAGSASYFTPLGAGGAFGGGPLLVEPRDYSASALLPNGQVLIVGGEGRPSSAELFNPATDTFTKLASGPPKRATARSRRRSRTVRS